MGLAPLVALLKILRRLLLENLVIFHYVLVYYLV